jgi:hypothetical protein
MEARATLVSIKSDEVSGSAAMQRIGQIAT